MFFLWYFLRDQEKPDTSQCISDDRLKHLDAKMIEIIESEIIDKGTPIGMYFVRYFDDHCKYSYTFEMKLFNVWKLINIAVISYLNKYITLFHLSLYDSLYEGVNRVVVL